MDPTALADVTPLNLPENLFPKRTRIQARKSFLTDSKLYHPKKYYVKYL